MVWVHCQYLNCGYFTWKFGSLALLEKVGSPWTLSWCSSHCLSYRLGNCKVTPPWACHSFSYSSFILTPRQLCSFEMVWAKCEPLLAWWSLVNCLQLTPLVPVWKDFMHMLGKSVHNMSTRSVQCCFWFQECKIWSLSIGDGWQAGITQSVWALG
jgi:hypothetical protein